MNWYWIILIVIGYMLIWVLASAMIYKYIERTDVEILPSIVVGMLWPIIIPLVLVGVIVKLIVKK